MIKPKGRSNRTLLIIMVAMMAIVAVFVVVAWQVVKSGPRDREAAATSTPAIGGPFTLVDQNGNTVSDQAYAGLYRLIYFGYTSCPDACPTELQIMGQAVDSLGPDAKKVQPIFITIDPARDTPPQLASYVPQFDRRLVGLTGTPQQIAQVAKEFRVYYAKADNSPSYAMEHSSFVYLMDPAGKFITVFSSDTDADKMAEAIEGYMRRS
jgi:protein SCO1/2